MKPYIRKPHIIMEIVSYVLVISSLALAIAGLFIVKDDIPIHYNLAGEVDGTGSVGSLLFFPIIMLFTNAMCSLLMRTMSAKYVNLPFTVSEEKLPIAMGLSVWLMELTIFDFSLMSIIMIIFSLLSIPAGGVILGITAILIIEVIVIMCLMAKKCK